MKKNTIFDPIHNAFEPIINPNQESTGTGLPEGFTESGERILYAGSPVPCENINAPVREDGPDAWGCQIKVPAGGAYRWDSTGAWLQGDEHHSKYIWITHVGTVVDVIYISDDTPHWITYTGTEL